MPASWQPVTVAFTEASGLVEGHHEVAGSWTINVAFGVVDVRRLLRHAPVVFVAVDAAQELWLDQHVEWVRSGRGSHPRRGSRMILKVSLVMVAIAAAAVFLSGCSRFKSKSTESTVNTPAHGAAGSCREAIDAALDKVYPTTKDYCFGLQANETKQEPPLAEVVVYCSEQPVPHLQYISYGLR